MFDGPLVSLPWVHWPYYCIITPNITRVSPPSGHKLNSNPKGFLAMTSMTVLAEYVQYCTSTSIAVEVEFGQFLWCRSIKYKYCKIQSNSLSWLFLSTHPNQIQLWPTLLFMNILRIVVFIHILLQLSSQPQLQCLFCFTETTTGLSEVRLAWITTDNLIRKYTKMEIMSLLPLEMQYCFNKI